MEAGIRSGGSFSFPLPLHQIPNDVEVQERTAAIVNPDMLTPILPIQTTLLDDDADSEDDEAGTPDRKPFDVEELLAFTRIACMMKKPEEMPRLLHLVCEVLLDEPLRGETQSKVAHLRIPRQRTMERCLDKLDWCAYLWNQAQRSAGRKDYGALSIDSSEQYGWNYFAVKSDVLYVKPDAPADAVLKSDFHVMVQRDP